MVDRIVLTYEKFKSLYTNQSILDIFKFIDFNITFLDKDMNILYSNWLDLDFVSSDKRVFGDKCYKVIRNKDSICEDCWVSKVTKYTFVVKFIKESPRDKAFRDFTIIVVYDSSEIIGYVMLIRKCSEFVEYQKSSKNFISICSNCKKVRDKGKWLNFEDYFLSLGLTFSHGICPDCLKIIYPEYADQILNKNRD